MNIDFWGERLKLRSLSYGLSLLLCVGLSGCFANFSLQRKPNFDGPGALPPLAYYQLLSRMTPAELNRERMVLAALPQNPNTQLRTAMLFGVPRGPLDLAKATQQLDLVLKSTDPAATALHPLARLLADNYGERQKAEGERQKAEGQLDRQGQQLKDSQRKVVELQEKIEGLADIERSLPARPRTQRPAGSRSAP